MMTGTLFLDHMGLCIRVPYDVICANAVWKALVCSVVAIFSVLF